MGDSNLDANKWDSPKFLHKNISIPLKNCLQQCGINILPVGNTYLADHMLQNGTIPESALDHLYTSDVINDRIVYKTLKNSATDHVPVKLSYTTCSKNTKLYSHQIQKRCLKNFTSEGWRNCLANLITT